ANDPSPIGMVAKYGFIKNLDAPMLEDVREAARKLLVNQGLLEPAEGEQTPPPPQPNPKDVAAAEKDGASARKAMAEAEGQEIENMAEAFRLGTQIGAAGPPLPPAPAPNQPPQGG